MNFSSAQQCNHDSYKSLEVVRVWARTEMLQSNLMIERWYNGNKVEYIMRFYEHTQKLRHSPLHSNSMFAFRLPYGFLYNRNIRTHYRLYWNAWHRQFNFMRICWFFVLLKLRRLKCVFPHIHGEVHGVNVGPPEFSYCRKNFVFRNIEKYCNAVNSGAKYSSIESVSIAME